MPRAVRISPLLSLLETTRDFSKKRQRRLRLQDSLVLLLFLMFFLKGVPGRGMVAQTSHRGRGRSLAAVAFVNRSCSRGTDRPRPCQCRWLLLDHSTPFSSWSRANTEQRCPTSLAATNRNDDGGRRRPMPPTLDEWDYDEGFGAYDYEPDPYDLEDMQYEGYYIGDDGIMYPKQSKQQHQPIMENGDTPTTAGPVEQTLNEVKEVPVAKNNHDQESLGTESHSNDDETAPLPKSTGTDMAAGDEGTGVDISETKSTETNSREEIQQQTSPSAAIEERETPPSSKGFQRGDKAFFQRGSAGTGVSTELDLMEDQLEIYKQELIEATNNTKFNANSPQQISIALYGYAGETTNKDVLEAMAASGNRIADLVMKYRSLSREITKRQKRKESREKGTYAKSVYTVKRSVPREAALEEEKEEKDDQVSTPEQPRSRPQATVVPEDPLLLVDASAYIFRAYYAYPPLHRSDGMPIGAVLGFCNMLNRLVLNAMMKGEHPRVVLVFDAPGKNFRHGLYEAYKANRAEAPVDLIPQFALIREVAKAYGIPQLEAPRYEADDVIATLATMALAEGLDANIMSGDKDLMQLVTPSNTSPSVQIIDPMSMNRVSYEDVVEKWGVGPEKLGDVLALAGDSSDNIPGVPGIGPKIAASLIDDFGSLDNLLENLDAVKQKGRREKLVNNLEQARLSRQLVELERNVPMDIVTFPEGIDKVGDLRIKPMDVDSLVQFFDEMGLRDLKRRFEQRLKAQRGFKWNPPKNDANAKAAPQKREQRKFYQRPKSGIPDPSDFRDVPF